MSGQDKRSPPLPPHHAFVVQFRIDTQIEAGCMTGRVEHVITGNATHFQSLDALLAFMTRMLREVQATLEECA